MKIEPEFFTDERGHPGARHQIPHGAPITVKILADSITEGGSRLVTWIWEYPRSIHAEVMTYRVISRNLASSRAIPTSKLRKRVVETPVVPVHWGQNQAGMQASTEVADTEAALAWWLRGRDLMAEHHAEGERMGLHKQVVNRIIEPWMQAVGVISMTDHANMFHQRKHKDAEPNFQVIATLAWELFHNHMPTYIAPGGWHLPFIETGDIQRAASTDELLKLSVGRCARVSYLTHEGIRDAWADIELHDKLVNTFNADEPGHFSPFEHQAEAMGLPDKLGYNAPVRFGNFEGWRQYRKRFEKEAGPDTTMRCTTCGCWGARHVRGCDAQ